jgi:hypothetical protein
MCFIALSSSSILKREKKDKKEKSEPFQNCQRKCIHAPCNLRLD